jgi:DNA modification methylase
VTPAHTEPLATIYHGDCVEVMGELEAASIDAIVCDPPYGLEFMGKEWDRLVAPTGGAGFSESSGKPDQREHNAGGTWFGSRKGAAPNYTGSPNPSCRICGGSQRGNDRRGGFTRCRCENPDFPNHRLNQATAMQQWHHAWARAAYRVLKPGGHLVAFGGPRTFHRLTCALEDAGFEIRDCLSWLYGSGFPKSKNIGNGWGTALKPAWEPIILARKPLGERNVAANVLRHGTGAINVDGCRVAGDVPQVVQGAEDRIFGNGKGLRSEPMLSNPSPLGRWPANLVLDEAAAGMLDEQSGELTSGVYTGKRNQPKTKHAFGTFNMRDETPATYGDTGGASRFFYTAKADAEDRDGSKHPTVKPVDLMKWLIRLVTPPEGVVLDPFLGSGTTVYAARALGIRSIGIEREAEYVATAIFRLRQGVLL